MKFNFKIRRGKQVHEHLLELPNPPAPGETNGKLSTVLNGEIHEAEWAEISRNEYSVILNGHSYNVRVAGANSDHGGASTFEVRIGGKSYKLELRDPRRRSHAGAAEAGDGPVELTAPMPGRIVKILVLESQDVSAGDALLVIEAMKMQNELRAPRAGKVEKIFVAEGKGVEINERLVRLV